MAPPKKRKVVKHLKKNWKKHSDINDVEEYLEDKRLEERTGGIIAEKKDDQLFFVDSVPKAKDANLATKKIRKIDEPMRCFANLQPDPNVPVPNTKQSGEKGKRKTPKSRLPPAIKRQTDPKLIKRLRASVKQHAINQRRKDEAKLANDEGKAPIKDLWGSDDDMKEEEEDDDDDCLAFHNRITKVTRVAVPNSRDAMKKKASLLPAVQVPHPGASYNPDLTQYLNHLGDANRIEEKKVKEEKKLERELDAKFPSKDDAKSLASNWLQEMSSGLTLEEDLDCDEEKDDAQETGTKKQKEAAARRKTKKQRRKAKEQKTLKRKLGKKKSAKQRMLEVQRLKSIGRELTAMDKEQSDRLKKKEILNEKRAKAGIINRLGKTRYEPMDVEVKLSEELVGDMRSLVPEGHLLQDRYDSLKKRNLIAPGERQKKGQRKYKQKKQEKRAWRAVTLDDVDVPIATV